MENNIDLIKQFNQFRNSLQGQNPQAILDQLVKSGRVSQEQVDKAEQMAKQFSSILR